MNHVSTRTRRGRKEGQYKGDPEEKQRTFLSLKKVNTELFGICGKCGVVVVKGKRGFVTEKYTAEGEWEL